MQLENHLRREEAIRLECLRLAVAANWPASCEIFYHFIVEGTWAVAPASPVETIIEKAADATATASVANSGARA